MAVTEASRPAEPPAAAAPPASAGDAADAVPRVLPDAFIGVRQRRLADRLVDRFDGCDTPTERRQLCRLLGMLFRVEGRELLVGLRDDYYGFNPDLPAAAGDLDQSDDAFERLMERLDRVLTQANFSRIPDEKLGAALGESAELDVQVKVPDRRYRHVSFFSRGRRDETVVRRRFWGLLKRKVRTVRLHHVVVVIRFDEQPERKQRMPEWLWHTPKRRIAPGKAVIKLFHSIAEADINMLYPSARAVMRVRDKLMLGVPALAGGVPVLLNILPAMSVLFVVAATYLGLRAASTVGEQDLTQALAAISALAGLGGFCMRQWVKFERQALKYQMALSDNLYYRNVCNNAAVFDFLIGTAEDQEFKETALAYFHLAQDGPLRGAELKRRVEDWLVAEFNTRVDFDLPDALDKLDRLNLLVTGRDGRFSVPPVADSLQALRGHWLTAAGIARGGNAEPPASRVDAAELPPSEIA
ncbi:MAG: DUF3754 domain-containing protein [Rhodospirillaceae bacterium]|nr:DUF3754 domain-containing protein [Rhodospirillaceae bacterium]MCA8930965.1 DUF3754 domain-containing protein [Rhodospirillaceae bacterium]